MNRWSTLVVIVSLASASLANGPSDDQQLIDQAPAQRPDAGAAATPSGPRSRPDGDEELARAERQARAEANAALARLELILGRKALRGGRLEDAAGRAQRVLTLLRRVPPGMDVSEIELQAEGILAVAARAGIDVGANSQAGVAQAPLPEAEGGAPAFRIGGGGDARGSRVAPRQQVDRHAYRPGDELIDVDGLLSDSREGLVYQDALRQAYKADEVRLLVEAEATRRVPAGVVSYPSDWPQRTARRAKWADGVIARSRSWHDKDGREWYVAIYDISDLIYVPPDFGMYGPFQHHFAQQRDLLDRRALLRGGMFGWGCVDSQCVIPLLRYFGGVNPWVDRGPKYSLERQQQIVQMIRAFTGGRAEGVQALPPAPR